MGIFDDDSVQMELVVSLADATHRQMEKAKGAVGSVNDPAARECIIRLMAIINGVDFLLLHMLKMMQTEVTGQEFDPSPGWMEAVHGCLAMLREMD